MASAASLELIRTLVGFDTVSAKSNLALIDFVRGYLEDHGVASRLVHDETGAKANLYATIGPDDRPGVMLSGHSDVVPVTGQAWASDPFRVVEREGRLYGRGTADMKSFLAIALAQVPTLAARRLATPLHLAVSYDEEVGCLGVRRLIDVMAAMPLRPAMCIIGEPTGMKVVVAHKGKRAVRVHVRGLECHSSLAPQGVNAIEAAARLIVYLHGEAGRLRWSGPRDGDFEVPYTTLQTGTIRGGTALNIVPGACSFDFEVRNLPGDDPEALLAAAESFAREALEPAMQAVDPATGIAFAALSGYPGLDTDPEAGVVAFVKALAGANDHAKITFGTEGGLFQSRLGLPTVVCGPGHIAQAHKPDEWIALEQLALCERFMGRLIERLASEEGVAS